MSDPTTLIDVNGTVFFSASSSAFGRELWKTDGSVLGTNMLKDINPGFFFAGPNLFGTSSNPQNFTNVNGTLFFTASDFSSAAPTGTELWKSDGTPAGTVLVRNINATGGATGPNSSNPANLVNVNGVLFFTADDGVNGIELWRSDAAQGAVRVEAVNRPVVWNPQNLTNVNGTLYSSPPMTV